MIELRKITKENYEECLNLNIADSQKNFVSSNIHSLAQAWVYYDTAFPFAIYANNTMIGFIMLGYYEVKGYYTLWKFMIDEKFQNKGYGKKALKLGIDYLINRFNVKEVYTAYYATNRIARDLYASIGFRETGEIVENEIGMKLIINNMKGQDIFMNLTIKPLTESNIDDYFDFFDNRAFSDDSPFAPCYCNCFHLTAEEVRINIGDRAAALGGGYEGTRLALRESAEKLIKEGILHGYLAYEDNLSIGWCNANDQQNYIRTGSFDPGKHQEEDYYISPGEKGKIKSLVCFEIAPGYRGKGIAKALLQRVCEDAKKEGFEQVEVYPQSTESYSTLDFNGPVTMYRNAGFEEIKKHGNTIVMRKKL